MLIIINAKGKSVWLRKRGGKNLVVFLWKTRFLQERKRDEQINICGNKLQSNKHQPISLAAEKALW